MKSFIAPLSGRRSAKKVNYAMLIQWIVFFLVILLIGLVSGAIDGFIKVIKQAKRDIFED
jgi:hypothetical protein